MHTQQLLQGSEYDLEREGSGVVATEQKRNDNWKIEEHFEFSTLPKNKSPIDDAPRNSSFELNENDLDSNGNQGVKDEAQDAIRETELF